MSAASELRSIVHAVVITRDYERAMSFYRDLVGLRVHRETVHDPRILARLGGPVGARARAAILRAPDGSEIEVACFAAPDGEAITDAGWTDAGIRSVTFAVDDVPSTLKRLADSGYRPAGEIVSVVEEGKPVRVVYVDGPDGVIVTFIDARPS